MLDDVSIKTISECHISFQHCLHNGGFPDSFYDVLRTRTVANELVTWTHTHFPHMVFHLAVLFTSCSWWTPTKCSTSSCCSNSCGKARKGNMGVYMEDLGLPNPWAIPANMNNPGRLSYTMSYHTIPYLIKKHTMYSYEYKIMWIMCI